MEHTKLYCVLEQGKYINEKLTLKHKEQFSTPFSDFYRLNWFTDNDPNANFHAKNITLSEGKNILYDKVPKIYKYYIFIDDDVDFECRSDVALELKRLLNEYNPLHATLYRTASSWGSWHVHYLRKIHSEYQREAWPIYGFDLDCDIYHYSYAEVIFPIKYHGCYKCLGYAQYICYKLYPEKQIIMTGINISNNRMGDHSDEKALPQSSCGAVVTSLFRSELKDNELNVDANLILNNEYIIPTINADIYLGAVNIEEVIFDKFRLSELLK